MELDSELPWKHAVESVGHRRNMSKRCCGPSPRPEGTEGPKKVVGVLCLLKRWRVWMFSEPPRSSSKGPKGRPGTQKTPEGPPRNQSGIQGPQQKAQIKRVEEL